MLKTKILPAADNAFQYPLLIKRLLMSGARYEKTREIVYRDQLRYSYATFNERVARLANVLSAAGVKAGDTVAVTLFAEGQKVDVTGTSIGKGFQGGIKRHNFASQRASHGNSISHRAHGSTGSNQDPGRVWKGKRMAGHMGQTRVTTQNLEVVSTDEDRGLILVKGAVPGSKGSWIIVRDAVKSAAK